MAAPKKKSAKVSEYGGMEKYPSKKAMMAHEKKESKSTEKSEKNAFMAMLKSKKKK